MGAAASATANAENGAAVQCTVLGLTPDIADALSDALLENGATSAA